MPPDIRSSTNSRHLNKLVLSGITRIIVCIASRPKTASKLTSLQSLNTVTVCVELWSSMTPMIPIVLGKRIHLPSVQMAPNFHSIIIDTTLTTRQLSSLSPIGRSTKVVCCHVSLNLSHRYHLPAPAAQAAALVPTPDATLINGKGRYAGGPAAPLAVISVTRNRRYRFRLVSISCDPFYTFSIDGHVMVRLLSSA